VTGRSNRKRKVLKVDEEFLLKARSKFKIIGPPITEEVILSVFPSPFPGRDDLVLFYLNMNGGGITPQCCLIHCGKPEHRVSRDNLENIRVEGFFSIPEDPGDRMLPFAQMLRHRSRLLETYREIPEAMAFLDRHMPIAFDHSGNGLWIDVRTGRVRFLDWAEYRLGSVEIAPSFRDFVAQFWNGASMDEPPE
jgi:hypothetical protein